MHCPFRNISSFSDAGNPLTSYFFVRLKACDQLSPENTVELCIWTQEIDSNKVLLPEEKKIRPAMPLAFKVGVKARKLFCD